jgi:hypothetical protein
MNNPAPLSAEEAAARDARARELGLLPKEEGEDNQYGSLAEAQTAAGGVGRPELNTVLDQEVRRQGTPDRQTAREFLASHPAAGMFIPQPVVKLPDFTQVQLFDFSTNVLYIDGLAFKIPEADVRDMKRYAVDLALDHVVKQLAEALIAFGVPQELADQMGASVREKANGSNEGDGTTADAGAELVAGGEDQEAARTPRPE